MPIDGGFWPDVTPEATIWRFKDRVFVGAGADATGIKGNGGATGQGGWLDNNTIGAAWGVRDSTFLVMTNNGRMAISGFSRTSDQVDEPGIGECAIGVSGFVINDGEGLGAWALYADVQHEDGAGWSAGLEVAAKNKGSNGNSTPYDFQGGVFGIWLAAGGDPVYGGAPTNPSNTAITVLKNGHTWNKAIVIGKDALTGCDGVTGIATALEMGTGHQVAWANVHGTTARIRSDIGGANLKISQVFSDGGVTFYDNDGSVMLGADRQKRARFGVFTATPSSVSGYITIKDASGVDRKLAVLQ